MPATAVGAPDVVDYAPQSASRQYKAWITIEHVRRTYGVGYPSPLPGSTLKMTELAFLGTGVMGLPMVRNLDEAGFAVHAYNRTGESSAAAGGGGDRGVR